MAFVFGHQVVVSTLLMKMVSLMLISYSNKMKAVPLLLYWCSSARAKAGIQTKGLKSLITLKDHLSLVCNEFNFSSFLTFCWGSGQGLDHSARSSCDDLLGSLCPRVQLHPLIIAMLIIPQNPIQFLPFTSSVVVSKLLKLSVFPHMWNKGVKTHLPRLWWWNGKIRPSLDMCPALKGPLPHGLMLCCHHLEMLNNFFFF